MTDQPMGAERTEAQSLAQSLEQYQACLEKTFDLANKDYWAQYLEVSKHQTGIAKTYLWVAMLLLGLYGSGYTRFRFDLKGIFPLHHFCYCHCRSRRRLRGVFVCDTWPQRIPRNC